MKKIGLLVAVEIKAVFRKYYQELEKIEGDKYRIYLLKRRNYTLYIIHSKAGQIRTAAAVQYLVDSFQVDLLVNFGVVGALREDFEVGQTCLVHRVVHYHMDSSQADGAQIGKYFDYQDIYLYPTEKYIKKVAAMYPFIPLVTCASGDKFIGQAREKEEMAKSFDAHICDMESAAVVLISDINKLPCFIIKTISDSLKGGFKEFQMKVEEASDMCLSIVDDILEII